MRHDNVAEASVIGVPMEGFGEVPRAFVVLKSGLNDENTKKELIKFLNGETFVLSFRDTGA